MTNVAPKIVTNGAPSGHGGLAPLVVTMGDPAGVGPEIAGKAWRALRGTGPRFVWIGDPSLLDVPWAEVERVDASGFDARLPVLRVPLAQAAVPGRPDPLNAPAILACIERAVALSRAGEASGVVTCPIAKSVLARAGFPHPGHTEFLAALCGAAGDEIMMLASPDLRVVPATIHVSLRTALDAITTELIVRTGRAVISALREDFGLSRPRLAVAGLNPHAGEDGMMGREEIEIVAPAVAILAREEAELLGPMPPDTMFTDAARMRYDAALCLYHDQALIPLKTLDMARGVNITLGLPIVRTSPDHGTAFDIAGRGIASAESLIAALTQAETIAQVRAGQG